MLPDPIPQMKSGKLVDEWSGEPVDRSSGARGLVAQVRSRLIRRVEERMGWGAARRRHRLRIRVSERRSRFLMVRLLVAIVLRVVVAPPVTPQADVALQVVTAF